MMSTVNNTANPHDSGLASSTASTSSSSSNMPAAIVQTTMATKFQPPSTSTFSFKAPFPPSAPLTSPTAVLKQRRVSLALPSTPRVIPDDAWSFRDDTTLNAHRLTIAPGHANGNESDTDALLPTRKGKIRRIANDTDDDFIAGSIQNSECAVASSGATTPLNGSGEKKQRKKWSMEETQMLVEGCRKHGVGSWKTILNDKAFKFDNRSPVDLKDRFRTYFPDAYKTHYPNAKTHLSSKIKRSTLPDGTPLFEKTRSKKRRPFTEQEDKALKEGYEKHGTVWALIVKDPIFQEQGRRSTDLRDRFRNAFPELYQAAGYKPRSGTKKKEEGGAAGSVSTIVVNSGGPGSIFADSNTTGTSPATATSTPSGWRRARVPLPVRAATDDQLAETGPMRRRRKAMRGGTKSVPQSAAVSEDEAGDSGLEDDGLFTGFRGGDSGKRATRQRRTTVCGRGNSINETGKRRTRSSSASASMSFAGAHADSSVETNMDYELEVDVEGFDSTAPPCTAGGSEPLLNFSHSQSTSGSPSDLEIDTKLHSRLHTSGMDTPVHGSSVSHHAWSPTSSQLSSDVILSQTHTPALSTASPLTRRLESGTANGSGMGMIGKSAWGTQDWLFSSNPRLDSSSGTSSNNTSVSHSNHSTSSFPDLDVDLDPSGGLSPGSPFSFHHLNHGVMDRYDLFPPPSLNMPHHNLSHGSSSHNPGHHQNHLHHSLDLNLGLYQNDELHDDFTSVSSEAGFGDRDAHSTFSDDLSYGHIGFRGFTHHSNYAGDLIFGARTHQPQQSFYGGLGLGLGFGGSYASGAAVSGNAGSEGFDASRMTDDMGLGLDLGGMTTAPPAAGLQSLHLHTPALPGIDEIELTGISLEDQEQPTPSQGEDAAMEDASITSKDESQHQGTTAGDRYDLTSIDDLIDLSQHEADPASNATPPATPLMQPRSSHHHRSINGFNYHSSAHHGRSVSVPPGEARSSPSRIQVQAQLDSQPAISAIRSVPLFSSLSQIKLTDNTTDVATRQSSTPLPSNATLGFSFTSAGAGLASSSTAPQDYIHNLPFLDLHYYGQHNGNGGNGVVDASAGMNEGSNAYRQGQALDLAAPSATATSLKSLGIPASLSRHILPASSTKTAMAVPTVGAASASRPLHQRGQSVVSPQDLLLRKGSDNKRKRSSWDGAAF